MHVVGWLEPAELAALYRAAEVTVSIPRSDSSPRSVWEAMASGSAMVVSNLPWAHELLVDGENALVVEARPEPVAAAIERLLADEALREQLAASGRSLVERHRDREAELDRLESCYLELLT